MNKEYIYVDDDTIVVSDENGEMSKRVINEGSIDDVLYCENNIESLNEAVYDIGNEIESKKTMKSNWKKNNQKLRLAFLGGSLLVGVLSSAIYPEVNPLPVILLGLSPILPNSIIQGRGTKRFDREISGLYSELEQAQQLREEYEKQLKMAKSKDRNEITKENQEIAKVKNDDDFIDDELEKSYIDGYNKIPKRLILSPKRKRN